MLGLRDGDLEKEVLQVLDGFVVGPDRASKLKRVFEDELEKGLRGGLQESSLQMENTYVPELTNGTENGSFLALDLGGTNFRVKLIQMKDGKITREEIQYFTVEDSVRLGAGTQLFDFLAACVKDFVTSQGINHPEGGFLPLGFTFSFPMTQMALDQGILVSWTKSFNCEGVVGKDAAQMLSQALDKLEGIKVKVVAILNDTTGTLVKGSYDDPNTCIGLILGTGCNGAYIERSEKVSRWQGGRTSDSDTVIIDAEFGAFGDNGCSDFLKTKFDRQIDAMSLFPGSFTLEKYFSGKYLGDLVRLVLLELRDKGLFLAGVSDRAIAARLDQSGSFTAKNVSHCVEDYLSGGDQRRTEETLGASDVTGISSDDALILQNVCHLLSERCALLVAIPLAVFLERVGRGEGESSAIAVTGSLYQWHPTIKISLEKYIRKWTENKSKVYTFLSEDGSGKGAGLVAAIAARLNLY